MEGNLQTEAPDNHWENSKVYRRATACHSHSKAADKLVEFVRHRLVCLDSHLWDSQLEADGRWVLEQVAVPHWRAGTPLAHRTLLYHSKISQLEYLGGKEG